jgi:hypothetical protein
MGNLAGDVFQVMCPRTADDDGVIQWEGTAKKLSSRGPVPSASLRMRLSILYYRVWRNPACDRALSRSKQYSSGRKRIADLLAIYAATEN